MAAFAVSEGMFRLLPCTPVTIVSWGCTALLGPPSQQGLALAWELA